MKTVYFKSLPVCDICKSEKALYDAPMINYIWGYFCEECMKKVCNLKIVEEVGTKLQQRTPTERFKIATPLPAVEPTSMEYYTQALAECVRTVSCPSCGEPRRLEIDASGEIVCDGCKQKMIVRSIC